MFEIRLAEPGDVPRLPEIEERAGEMFKGTPVEKYVSPSPLPVSRLDAGRKLGLLWVALTGEGTLVGFVLAEHIGGGIHIEEVDVLPEYGRLGIGTALIQRVLRKGKEEGCRAVTLCTFRDVPWNAPFYARLGFEELHPSELTPALRQRMREEAERGLPAERRLAMRCRVEIAQPRV